MTSAPSTGHNCRGTSSPLTPSTRRQLDGVATDCTQAWELHHYLIAWIGTLFCAFDHPASVVCLAITTGIFVQGLAAYGPAEISDRRAEYVDWSPNGPT